MLFITLGICAALSLFGWLWIVLGLALLFLPSLFAATHYLGTAFTGDATDTRIITHAFGVYFRPPMLGVYRAIFNSFLALISSFGLAAVVMFSYYLVALNVDPAFLATAESVLNSISLGNYEAAMSLLQTDPGFIRMGNIAQLVFVYALVFFFWLYVSKYMQNAVLRKAFAVESSHFANYYYGHYRVIAKKEWLPLRAPFFLFSLSIMVISIVTSSLCYGLGMEVHYALLTGLLTLSFLFALYLPLGLYLQLAFAFAHQKDVEKAFYVGSQKILTLYEASGRFSKEEMDKMRNDVERLRPKDEEENED